MAHLKEASEQEDDTIAVASFKVIKNLMLLQLITYLFYHSVISSEPVAGKNYIGWNKYFTKLELKLRKRWKWQKKDNRYSWNTHFQTSF